MLSGGSLLNMILGTIFSLIGVVVWKYGKSQSLPKKMILGGLLSIYTLFTPEWVYTLWGGCAILMVLYFWRDE